VFVYKPTVKQGNTKGVKVVHITCEDAFDFKASAFDWKNQSCIQSEANGQGLSIARPLVDWWEILFPSNIVRALLLSLLDNGVDCPLMASTMSKNITPTADLLWEVCFWP
jgi:hypothetical protein